MFKDKEKKREYQRLWLAKRRSDYLEDKCCVVCGATKSLEIDHIDPDLKSSHRIWSWSKERREAELAKCQILCYKCHKQKTILWREGQRAHGRSMYRYGCRCDLCVQGNREIHTKSREKMKQLRVSVNG